ncbi:hypothetical protein NDU88_005023 [Pleurodeles waltl]|uniref:Uncharacterized protein n=1 Tax=Pleurodeles waltl TaxID=8319 RepID=A0AAV7NU55_PLEWA|nr:hypothetical protein NDU88_005023 [Pleurodeles waltl]
MPRRSWRGDGGEKNPPGPEPPHSHNSSDAEPCPGTPQERDVRQGTRDSPQADKAWQEGRSRVFGRPGTACPQRQGAN